MSQNAVKRDPFGPTTSAATYVPRPATDDAFASLERAVVEEGRVGLLYGPGGIGKTLLLRRLADSASHLLKPVHLPYAAMSPDEVCSWTLEALGASAVDDPPTVFRAWLEHLRRERTLLLLVVDDATALPAETARWLGQLAKDGALRLVLAALAEAVPLALREELPEDAEIVGLTEAMSEEETRVYVETRLEVAEVPEEQRAHFDLAAIRKIHGIAKGNPRRLHHAAGAVLRGADPDTIVAFLDGLDPEEEAAAGDEGTPRITIGAALLAQRRAEEAKKPPRRKIKPMRPIELRDLEELAQVRPAGVEEPVGTAHDSPPPIELPEPPPNEPWVGPSIGLPETPATAPAQPGCAAESASELAHQGQPAPERRIPDAAQVLAEALADVDGAVEGVDAGEEAPRSATPLPASQDEAHPEAEASDEEDPLEIDSTLRKAGQALVEATGLLRDATLSLGEPGTPRGQARAALRDAVDALSEAIVAAHSADRRAGGRTSALRAERPRRVLWAAFGRVAAVVVASALIGAGAVSLFSASEQPGGAEEAATQSAATPPAQMQDQPAPAAAESPAVEVPASPVFQIGINAKPWAEVEVDGEDIGVTPIAGLELTEGLHIFRAQMPDGRIVVRRVEVGPETRNLVFR